MSSTRQHAWNGFRGDGWYKWILCDWFECWLHEKFLFELTKTHTQLLFLYFHCLLLYDHTKSLINTLDKNDIIDLSNEVAVYEYRIIKKKTNLNTRWWTVIWGEIYQTKRHTNPTHFLCFGIVMFILFTFFLHP